MLTQKLQTQFQTLIGAQNAPLIVPLAVAFSGGGDSTALLSLVCEWAKHHTNLPVFALIVDHGLREGSVQEAQLAASRAQAMGARAEVLTWVNDNPQTGIQEKARKARYALMGAACRRIGVRQLFLGHTSDDQAETLFMRAQKHSGWRGFAGMYPRKRSPIWPELYDVEIVRPLLDVSRQALRDYNAQNTLEYFDDPSNENHKFTRVRARAALADMVDVKAQFLVTALHAQKSRTEENRKIKNFIDTHVTPHDWGGLSVDVMALHGAGPLTQHILNVLIKVISGETQAIPTEKLKALCEKLLSDDFRGATLGGARFVVANSRILGVRDAGAVLGRTQKLALEPMDILPDSANIWDGRFLLETDQEGLRIAPVMNVSDRLSKIQKQALKTVPEPARAGLPCVLDGDIVVWSFGLERPENLKLTSLIPTHIDVILN